MSIIDTFSSHRDLARRATAEAVGTGLLVTAVVGSGIFAARLSPGDRGLQLLENAVATGAALVALILCLGSVSGAHFNPVVSLAERVLGGYSNGEFAAYVVAQLAGGVVGAVVANMMFELGPVSISSNDRIGTGAAVAEVVATFGLLLVILGTVRSHRTSSVPFAVGGYITAAYWFTSSTSFANPAVTVARIFSDSFAGIAPLSAPGFVVAQIAGALLAIALARFLFPDLLPADLVVPHEAPDPANRP